MEIQGVQLTVVLFVVLLGLLLLVGILLRHVLVGLRGLVVIVGVLQLLFQDGIDLVVVLGLDAARFRRLLLFLLG